LNNPVTYINTVLASVSSRERIVTLYRDLSIDVVVFLHNLCLCKIKSFEISLVTLPWSIGFRIIDYLLIFLRNSYKSIAPNKQYQGPCPSCIYYQYTTLYATLIFAYMLAAYRLVIQCITIAEECKFFQPHIDSLATFVVVRWCYN